MLTIRSTINIAGQTVPQIIPVVQGDTGRSILFTLADFTIPQGSTATYYVQKPSGEAVYNAATIDGNTVLVELTAQSIIERGDNYGQVRIENDGEVVTSFDFILLVKPFRGIDATQSTTEMNIFDKAVEQAEEAIDEAKVAALEEIAEAGSGNIADEFASTNSYLAGEYTIYQAKLYRFTSNHTGAWTGSDAEEVTVGEELTDVKDGLGEITKNLIPLKKINQTSNGVTITTDPGSGKVTATGQSTGAGFIVITPTITLPAGTYTIAPNASNHLYFQARSTDNTYLAQTGVGTSASFTLSAQTSLVIRATWTASFNETAEAYPQMESGSSATYFLPHMIADDDYARYMIGKLEDKALTFCGTLTNGADFNSADKIGYYLTNFSASYVNDPISGTNHRKALINIADQNSVPFIVQFLLNYDSANTILYYRMKSAGNWTDWRLMYRQTDVETLKSNVSSLLAKASDNTVLTNSDVLVSSSAANVGTNITVMSYNVANYNDDTTTYISDAKRTNFRKMLSQINPDFIGLQEAKEYIDGSNAHNAMDYIYRPMFPSHIIGSGGSILAKQGAPDTYDNMAFSNGRNLLFGRYAIGSKKLIMITAHPVAGTDSSAVSARLTQYTELIQFANREIQLTSADGRRTKYCPEWDYCIICADCNSITDDDKTNLKSLASGGGFTMANGGWLGWLETARNTSGSIVYSIDNILCSSNIIINSITAHKGLYADLYSDHYPLSAEVTLLS